MNRRSFVVTGICLSLAGCLREDESDDGETPGNQLREIDIQSDYFIVEREFPDQEAGVFELHLTNTDTEPRAVKVRLQMRNEDGDPVGERHTKTHGPVDPESSSSLQFELTEEQRDLVWYKLVLSDPESDEAE